MRKQTAVFKYLKAAFSNRWNLLALLGGVGVAVISGSPDVLLPVVLAAEAGYLAIVGANPKFQKYVDTMEHVALRETRSERNRLALRHILRSLPRPMIDRYNELRERCQDLQRIAADLQQPGQAGSDEPLESIQAQNLDRLLWIYLRLLFTYHSLHKFLKKTSRDRISNDVDRIRNRLDLLDPNDTSPHAAKIRRTLTDNLATSQNRILNFDRARANYEYVELEIDRLENKIKSLVEVAVNRQEPDYVSSQVDRVANSMVETEKTMNELQVFTGLGDLDQDAPILLETTSR